MATKTLPPQDLLLQLLRYDPSTGFLFWRARPVEMFADGGSVGPEGMKAAWDKQFVGTRAFCTECSQGYLRGKIFSNLYRSHRVIWKMVTGEDVEQIDHINGIRSDNRLENLRSVTSLENSRNQKFRNINTSGAMGVSRVPRKKRQHKWMAEIRDNGKKIYLGVYDSIDEARKAYNDAKLTIGFHRNHGVR